MAGKTVMVVDDSSTIRKIIQRELSKADFEVILAKNGMEALAILEWADPLPDLISLDIDMPKMNGFQVCERITNDAREGDEKKKQLAEIPIIFVSANDSAENRQRGFDLGVIDFISKPFVPGVMLSTINNILDSQEQFSGMSALVVEDSPFVRRLVKNILSRHGLVIHEVASGEEALEVLKEKQFDIDIIITDYIMPGMSGEELCQTLRSIEVLEQVPIFFISAVDTKDAILSFFRVGASDYLSKPFIEEEFRARVVTHLRNRKYVKELEHLNGQLKYAADHDSLSGLFNRGYFQGRLASIFMQARRTGKELCCLLIDLDYFKKINDGFGHAFGDLVIRQFSKILMNSCRPTDVVARYGGEEFIVLLPDTSMADGHAIAEQIRINAEGYIYNDQETELQVTISLGIASLHDHKPGNPDKLLLMADEALYRAKDGGRNRVEVYTGP